MTMNHLIQPAIGIFFIFLAIIIAVIATKNGRNADGRLSIAARTRFTISAIFAVVGIALVGFHLP